MSLLGPNLQAFLAVAQTKTVLAASKRIGITQTGVTQRIRTLESELGSTLFIRSRQGMRPTPEGEALLRYCQTVRDLEGETLARIRGAGSEVEVRATVLGPTSLMRTRLVPQIMPVLQMYSKLLVSFEVSDSRDPVDAIKTGDVDFAVLASDEVPRELESKRLEPQPFVLVGKKGWGSRPIREIVDRERIIDFHPQDAMTFAYLKKYKLVTEVQGERHFANSNEALLQMYSLGLGYGVMCREFARQHLGVYDVEILSLGWEYLHLPALAWLPRANPSPYFQSIIDATG